MEIFKKINERYEVSNLGVVRLIETQELVPICTQSKGYSQVWIGDKVATVHRLVASLFIPNPDGKPQVDHINGDKTDNRVENLRWVTNRENAVYYHELRRAKNASSL